MPTIQKAEKAIQNQLLSALPQREFDKIRSLFELVDLELNDVLWEMEEERKFVYFPTTAMICLMYETEEGLSIEVGMAGRKGMVGVVTFIGDSRMAKRAVVHHAGQAYRMKAKDVEKAFELCPDFQDICISFTQTLIAQISQSAICNRLHSIDQQFCRHLLINYENLQTRTFSMTHEQISNMLGVRRESISVAAAQLRDAGLIKSSRGKITVVDLKGLLAAACECYAVVKEQYDRILSKYISKHGE